MRSHWKLALWTLGTALLLAALLVAAAVHEVSSRGRDWVTRWLSAEFQSQAQLSSLRISFHPAIRATGEGLVLHFQGRQDLPPLLSIDRFSVQTSFSKLLRARPHIEFVRLEGLQLNIPPRDPASQGKSRFKFGRAWKVLRGPYFEEISAEHSWLRILPSVAGRNPREFQIEHLDLTSTSTDDQLAFRADLQNPAPPGRIRSTGTFGPWQSDAPSLTPVWGKYTFENANLGAFRGIAGILSSVGDYRGVLERIEVDGTTDTPDFRLVRAGNPVPLSTTFHAIVDGTNGDTYLEPVDARLANTRLVARGRVEGKTGQKGKEIVLDVVSDDGRLEDLLRLAIHGSPAISGRVRLRTKFRLAPGPQEIPSRLHLQGEFELASAHFNNRSVQQKVDNLSKRTSGNPGEIVDPASAVASDDVVTSMGGLFRLDSGTLSLAKLGFRVPGADVNLDGTYALNDEHLDLHGHFITEAKLSQTTTGVKSFLLKAVDPFLSKNGKGAVLPIRISGPVQHPSYRLDFGHRTSPNKD